ncbi:MAG: hypothetical protein AB8B56_05170 [Crocinitomicaceae bacterium]
MLRTKTIKRLTILRLIAFIAIVSFSFELSSPILFADDIEIEIVDLDLEDDTESDDELTTNHDFNIPETLDDIESNRHEWDSIVISLRDQHLKELSTPPPDLI